jgi:hypothetical protein
MLEIFCGILEIFLGNTFPFVVFTSYGESRIHPDLQQRAAADKNDTGAIFTAVAATLHPFYGSAAAYSATGNFAEGLTDPEFLASLGKIISLMPRDPYCSRLTFRNIAFFLIACAVLNVFFVIAALKVNVVYLLIFVTAGLGFTLLAAAFWALAEGAVAAGTSLQVVSNPLLGFSRTVD